MIIGMEQFGRYFTDFTSSATRIETLPVYADPDEKKPLDLYLTGAPVPPDRNVVLARTNWRTRYNVRRARSHTDTYAVPARKSRAG